MISSKILRALRNDLPMAVTIRSLGQDGPYTKISEGFLRFVCPHCHQMRATVNPRNNLAHCFCCHKNINNIDLILSLGYDFKSAVARLKKWLKEYTEGNEPTSSENEAKFERSNHPNRPVKLWKILSKISQSVGKV